MPVPAQPRIANLTRPWQPGEPAEAPLHSEDPAVPVLVRVVWDTGEEQCIKGRATHWRAATPHREGTVLIEGIRPPESSIPYGGWFWARDVTRA